MINILLMMSSFLFFTALFNIFYEKKRRKRMREIEEQIQSALKKELDKRL